LLLASLLAFGWLKREGGWIPFALSMLFAFGAMLAKETGVVLLALIPAFDLAFPDGSRGAGGPEGSATRAERRRRQRERQAASSQRGANVPVALRWGAILAVTLVYFLLRSDAVGERTLRAVAEPWTGLFGAVTWYAGKLIWPPPQSAFVHAVPTGAAVWAGALIVAGAAVAVIWLWRRAGWRAEAIALLILGGTLAPSLMIAAFRISETPLAERYGYIPSAGLCLLLAALALRAVERLPGGWARGLRAALAPALAVVIAVPGALATWERSGVWRNDLAFWTDTVARAPEQGLPHLHLGMTYADRGRMEEAERAYRKALETYDDAEGRSKAYNNLGALYMREGRLQEAADALRGALREVPDYPTAYYNLGIIEMNLARRDGSRSARAEHLRAARRNLSRALELNPRYVKAHLAYGRLMLSQGRAEEGVRHLRRVVQLAPSSAQAARARELLDRIDGGG
jgi:tetratricopeptide (TPR) repeat protein